MQTKCPTCPVICVREHTYTHTPIWKSQLEFAPPDGTNSWSGSGLIGKIRARHLSPVEYEMNLDKIVTSINYTSLEVEF